MIDPSPGTSFFTVYFQQTSPRMAATLKNQSGHYPECNAVTNQYKNILPVVLVRETFVKDVDSLEMAFFILVFFFFCSWNL